MFDGDGHDAWESVSFDVQAPGHCCRDDTFGCPCGSDTLRQVFGGVDVAAQGAALRRQPDPVCGSALLVNARIMTMDPGQPTADSLWVRDGRIAWIGARDDAPAEARREQLVDCEGRAMLPGFIDPHMHLATVAMLHSFENIGPHRFPRVDDAMAHLTAAAASVPAGEWIVARQFDPSLQEGADALTRDVLDVVSATHPIFVYNASLHLAYCNSVALEIAGIDASTPNPANAEIGRDADGVPNGVLKAGPAIALVARHNPYARNQDVAEACLDVFEHAARMGLTLLCDQGTGLFQGVKELALYRGLRNSNRQRVRFRYALGHALAHRWDEVGVKWGEGDEWLRNVGWKIVSDGSNQGRTGLQREPFLHSDEHGIAYIDPDDLNRAVEQRLREGWALSIHANGDAAIDRVLDAFERAAAMGLDPGARRCRIEHCSILHDEHIQRIAALGLSPSFLIGHVYYWGRAFVDDIFGADKAAKLDRTASCENQGIRWTLHSDDPVTEMNPLRCIANAVNRNMWRSDELLAPEERIPVAAALRAMTIDAAWQCHSDHEVGSLAVGKFADFVILNEDPRQVDPRRLGEIQVDETWVNGQQVFAREPGK